MELVEQAVKLRPVLICSSKLTMFAGYTMLDGVRWCSVTHSQITYLVKIVELLPTILAITRLQLLLGSLTSAESCRFTSLPLLLSNLLGLTQTLLSFTFGGTHWLNMALVRGPTDVIHHG